ncbi:MAG: acyltransferase family protein [Pseudomonadota bacterium]
MQGSRIHHLDMARAVLMTLGVVLHSAQIYNPETHWLVNSDDSFFGSSIVVSAIKLFRMPAFFVVSGFFCALTIQRYGADRFARVRLFRILLPFVSSLLVLNTLQAVVLVTAGSRHYDFGTYLGHSDFVSHLWFLVNLSCYFTAAWFGARYFLGPLRRVAGVVEAWFSDQPALLVILLLPCSVFFVYALGALGFPLNVDLHPGIVTFELIRYVPYFLFGVAAFVSPAARRTLLQFPAWMSVATLGVALAASFVLRAVNVPPVVERLLEVYFHEVAIWSAVLLCFSLFRRFCDRPSTTTRFFADASYTIYLFHHCLVAAFGIVLLSLPIPPLAQFVLLVVLVFACTALIHRFFIDRVPVARLLFNGKPSTRG